MDSKSKQKLGEYLIQHRRQRNQNDFFARQRLKNSEEAEISNIIERSYAKYIAIEYTSDQEEIDEEFLYMDHFLSSSDLLEREYAEYEAYTQQKLAEGRVRRRFLDEEIHEDSCGTDFDESVREFLDSLDQRQRNRNESD